MNVLVIVDDQRIKLANQNPFYVTSACYISLYSVRHSKTLIITRYREALSDDGARGGALITAGRSIGGLARVPWTGPELTPSGTIFRSRCRMLLYTRAARVCTSKNRSEFGHLTIRLVYATIAFISIS